MKFTEKRGRKFVAFAWIIASYLVAVVGVFLGARFAIDYNALIQAAGIVTVGAGFYIGGNAFQHLAEARAAQQEIVTPSVTVEEGTVIAYEEDV